jgi:hypothetical protein
MEREMQLLEDNKTWKLVKPPEGHPIVDCKWVYKFKDDQKEEEKKLYKDRLVAKGFTQEKSMDYNKVFSPIAKLATIRLIYALVAIFGLVMNQMDVVTAFFYGSLEEVIYMRQPIGFARKGNVH